MTGTPKGLLKADSTRKYVPRIDKYGRALQLPNMQENLYAKSEPVSRLWYSRIYG